jgi:hypothetical protein
MAHSHAHQHDSSYYLEQLCTIAFGGALGVVCILLWWTGKIGELLKVDPNDRLRSLDWPVLLAGITLLALILIQAVALWITAGRAHHKHDGDSAAEDEGHTHEHGIAAGPPCPAHCDALDHDHHEHDHGNTDDHGHHNHDHGHTHDHHHHDHSHTHGHAHAHAGHSHADHGHDHGWAPWRYMVLMVPITLGMLMLMTPFLRGGLKPTNQRDESANLEFPGAVSAVAFTREGKTALSASEDQTVKVWDLENGKTLRTFVDGAVGPIFGLALSPDGRQVLVASEGAPQAALPMIGVNTVGTLGSPGSAGPLQAASALLPGKPSLSLWNVADGKRVRVFDGHEGAVYAVAFSHDGKQALSGGRDGSLRLWDVAGGQVLQVFTGHNGPVTAVALSTEGDAALSSGKDGTLRLWNLKTVHEPRTLMTQGGPIYAVAFSPDGAKALAGGYDANRQVPEPRPFKGAPAGTLTLWDVASGKLVRTLSGVEGPIYGVAFSQDGKQALSGGYDGRLRLWDVGTGQEVHQWEQPKLSTTGEFLKPLTAVALSADGRRALSGSYDKTVRLWNLSSQEQVRTFEGHGKTLAGGSSGETIVLGFKELDNAAFDPKARKYYQGKVGKLKGQFVQGSDGRRFTLTRFKINCCAADAIPIRVVIIAPEPVQGIKAMQWVEVTGQIQFFKRPDREEYVPALMPASLADIRVVEPDLNPYIQ